ncbi:MAG: hypothetical protein Q7R49_02760 [Candidatus Daviesbacteria bacterium]|nr:hypothetical protein [Candidatus Daviesbacteria bacterium]
MARILTILSLIFALVLFPPAVLALVSSNAIPGDGTYPIKRKLEDGILMIASLTPQSKAWFAVERSSRRFKEAAVLLTKNEQASTTLTELVSQTSTAALEVNQISDPVKKQQLIEQLSESITTYNQGLSTAVGETYIAYEEQVPPPSPTPVPTPLSTPTPTPTPGLAFSRSTTVQQGQAPLTPKPSPALPTIQPTATPAPTIVPTPSPTPTPQASLLPQPTPQPVSSNDGKKEQVDQTRKELDKIKKRLEEEKEKIKEQRQNQTQNQREEKSQQIKETKQENNELTPDNNGDKIKTEKR